jgi:hypothetical protein
VVRSGDGAASASGRAQVIELRKDVG